jgi:hypothetical protein
VIGLQNSKIVCQNTISITIILGGVVAYFLLIAFCLSQPLPDGLADDPTVKGKGKDGECKIMP